MHGITNYVALLRRLERWRLETKKHICLITFNYDTMLEHGLADALGFSIKSMNSYLSFEGYSLIKAHGSVNWGRLAGGVAENGDPDGVRRQMIRGAGHYDVSRTYVLQNPIQPPLVPQDDRLVFPALAIPVEVKSEFELPDEHVAVMHKCIGEAEKVLIIGWRGAEDHFLSLWRERTTASSLIMHIVGANLEDAEEVYRRVSSGGLAGLPSYSEGGFSRTLATGQLEPFLSD
ncbi:MAG TPA: hypothetical protein VG929_05905 [Actinomycetota bacterium]|nr:hypothetical protein [Actinomycetota bacterium]